MKHNKKSEKYDICDFCSDFWGEDRNGTCETVCSCASYANQDYTYRREALIGLPPARGFPEPLQTREEPDDYWHNLSPAEKTEVADMVVELTRTLEPAMFTLLTHLMCGLERQEICQTMGIDDGSFYVYVRRLKHQVEKAKKKRKGVRKSTGLTYIV